MKRARQWLPRIAIAASLFALLGTSQPKWNLEVAGPDAGPPPDGQAELVVVETTGGADLQTTDRFGREHEQRASGTMTAGGLTRTERLLAPGEHFRSAALHGTCSGGLFGSHGPCVPSPSTILTARATRVAVWSRELVFPTTVHVAKSETMRPITILLTDPPEHAEVSISAARSFFDWSGKETAAFHPNDVEYLSYVLGPRFGVDADVELVVHVTAFGRCPDPAVACVAPPLVPAPALRSARVVP